MGPEDEAYHGRLAEAPKSLLGYDHSLAKVGYCGLGYRYAGTNLYPSRLTMPSAWLSLADDWCRERLVKTDDCCEREALLRHLANSLIAEILITKIRSLIDSK